MGSPIDWTHFQTWKQYTENPNGTGYRKNVYICREGSNWYDGSILKQDGLAIDRTCTATNYLEMGNVAAAALTITIVAPPLDISSWAVGQELEIQVDIFERTDPSIPEDGGSGTAYMGIFIIDSITERSGTYVIEALDRMVLLDVPMDWSGLVPPDIPSILNKISTVYGVTVATDITTLPNYFQMFSGYPNLTVRQVISTIAEVMGCCAFMDWNGELRFAWYEPILNANSSTLELTSDVAFSRRTDPQSYDLDDYGIGDPDGTKVEVTGPDECKYYLVGNALVESMRSAGLVVSGIADNIRAARYTDVQFQGEYHYYSSGEYEVLPFPYIWPMDVIDVDGVFAPINHVVYRLNANMSLTASADPRVSDYSTAFTSTQQTVLDRMESETEAINKHFFYTNATGAHITTVENDPDSGNNVLIDSSGVYIRENTDVLAEFTATDARIGESSSAHADISTSGLQVYESDGTTLIANLGYGPGKDSGGGTTNAPYYTLGARSGAIGNYSVAEGKATTASGYASHSEGLNTTVSGTSSHVEGDSSKATGGMAHSEGGSCTASGIGSHSEGLLTTASGSASHSEGWNSVASGSGSHAGGTHTEAASDYQTAIGQYNVVDSSDTYALIIGNGTADNARSNALTVDWYGNINCSGIKTDSKINFVSSQNPSYTGGYIQAVKGDANGSVLLIRPGASLIAGGGEYASNRWAVGDITATNEKTYIGADSIVYIESNGNTIGNRKTWEFDTSGNITTPTGGLINGVDITKLNNYGTAQTLSPTVTLASSTSWQNIMSFSLTPGLWFVEFSARFSNNASGYRGINISTTSGGSAQTYLLQDLRSAVDGTFTYCKISATYRTASNVTRYLNALQNSGSNVTFSMQYKLTLLKGE